MCIRDRPHTAAKTLKFLQKVTVNGDDDDDDDVDDVHSVDVPTGYVYSQPEK